MRFGMSLDLQDVRMVRTAVGTRNVCTIHFYFYAGRVLCCTPICHIFRTQFLLQILDRDHLSMPQDRLLIGLLAG